MSLEAPYAELSPETVLDALEVLDFRCDGRVLALNSYENRVYQIGIEDGEPVVAKFYRPGRWSDAAIRRGARLRRGVGGAGDSRWSRRWRRTAGRCTFTAAFAMRCFRAGEGAGRSLGWPMSASGWGASSAGFTPSGAARRFANGRRLSVEELGRRARDFVLEGEWMPDYLADKYADLTDELLEEVEARARGWRGARLGRILGDCHRGNILWTDLGPHFVDLDDCVTGPAIQDLWMLLAGSRQEMRTQLTDLLKGYEQFLPFDRQRIGADRAAAGAAHDSLFGMAGAALVRPGISEGLPLVRRAALLGGALPRARGAAGGGARRRRSSCERRRILGIIGAMMNRESADALCAVGVAGRLPPRREAPLRSPRPLRRSRRRSAKAAAAKTPQQLTADMVEAASQGKSQAPVTLKFDLLQRPAVGQPLRGRHRAAAADCRGPGRHRCLRLGQPAGGGRRQPDRIRRRRARAGLPAPDHGHADRRGDAVR